MSISQPNFTLPALVGVHATSTGWFRGSAVLMSVPSIRRSVAQVSSVFRVTTRVTGSPAFTVTFAGTKPSSVTSMAIFPPAVGLAAATGAATGAAAGGATAAAGGGATTSSFLQPGRVKVSRVKAMSGRMYVSGNLREWGLDRKSVV